MLHTIRNANVCDDRQVEIVFDDGTAAVVDFAPVIARGGVFAALTNQDVFSRVTIGEGGRSLEWPGELDFCADALWRKAHQEQNHEDTKCRPPDETASIHSNHTG